jgi:Domain of unknown function (DUF4136)
MKSSAALVAALVLAPVVLLAQKTSFDYDKTANFAAFKTFALKDGTKVGDPLVDNRIVAAIKSELGAKGLTESAAKPDLTVVYHVAFDKKQDITAYNTGGYGGYGYRWGGGFSTTDVRVNEILVGTLVIDIVDENKKELAWRGMGVREVDVQAKADKRDKNINSAVKKILKDFPPKKKA